MFGLVMKCSTQALATMAATNKQSLMMVSNLLPLENNCNNELLMYVCHSNIICDDFSVDIN